VEGAIPDTLSKLKKLTTINLSNNFLSGTLPEWLGELTELRVLNMGTQTGATEDQGLGGFQGAA
jgi:Ran GTPase-activating protein (RanGAP) involved in mRNA processing and transport